MMKIAFYAPLKSPTHPIPSGDRQMARLFMCALRMVGHEAMLVSSFRSWDDGTRSGRMERLGRVGYWYAERLIRYFSHTSPPDIWFTYHVYHKAPDWIGPRVSEVLNIPYIIAEPSFAPKQEYGPWALGYFQTKKALQAAHTIITLLRTDAICIRPLLSDQERLRTLHPFVELPRSFNRTLQRRRLAQKFSLPIQQPWLLTVGMMRSGDKLRSYEVLANALRRLYGYSWTLLIVGDGPQRSEVKRYFSTFPAERLRYLGELDTSSLQGLYASTDVFVWPAINEAYGMVFLEAQAAGIPVVAGSTKGVCEIVSDLNTGLLIPSANDDMFAAAVAKLLDDPDLRRQMGQRAKQTVSEKFNLKKAAHTLQEILSDVKVRSCYGRLTV